LTAKKRKNEDCVNALEDFELLEVKSAQLLQKINEMKNTEKDLKEEEVNTKNQRIAELEEKFQYEKNKRNYRGGN
jgi:hypothetical protein